MKMRYVEERVKIFVSFLPHIVCGSFLSILVYIWHCFGRCCTGIFRTPAGIEYVKEWYAGVRHGWGVLYHPNGEEYVGQWENGKMHGVGRLSAKNGDVYEGT